MATLNWAKGHPMDTNPVLKPKVATPALTVSSVAILLCAVFLIGTAASTESPPLFVVLLTVATFLLAAAVAAIWFTRGRKRREWAAAVKEKWNHFDELKRTGGTTAEITILSVDALEPTGSWITIRWDRFDHIQSAWLEALNEPIWPGSVLLISPDPAQVGPGRLWPTTYFIRISNFLAWAPGTPSRFGSGQPRA